MTTVWNVGRNGPLRPVDAYISHLLFYYFTLRGSRAHVPQVAHCVENNLLNTQEK